ncbi:IgGFc-binding protein isoform X2 [Antennarius striatus]
MVKIMALHGNTKVSFTSPEDNSSVTLTAGEIHEYHPEAALELSRSAISNQTLQITSSRPIIVHVIHQKKKSIQTALVTPADHLGTKYLVPPVPPISGPADPANHDATENSPFKLIIVNMDKENAITVKGEEDRVISLQPYQVAQVWVQDELRAVTADQPVTVLFGHTCAISDDCTCGQLFTVLPPTNDEEQTFYIPLVSEKDAEYEAFLLLSEEGSTRVMSFDPNSPVVKTAGSVILYRPGLLLTLTPETEFAACFVAKTIPNAENFAVILVHKDQTDGIHVGTEPLDNPVWQKLKGSDYVTTTLLIIGPKVVIWHASARMTVYFMGSINDAVFGNPGSVISKTPDFRGCVLTPETIEIGAVEGSWQESLMYCKKHNLDLVSIPWPDLQRQLSLNIPLAGTGSLKKLWIGMRRSSQTTVWYWLNAHLVNYTNWGQGEPGSEQEGQCAIMSVDGNDFEWRDADCCEDAHPICYREPEIFLVEPGSTQFDELGPNEWLELFG